MASNESCTPGRRRSSINEPPYMSGNEELRVLVFGRNGHSQFSLTNSILLREIFKSQDVCSIKEGQKHRGEVCERKIAVVNTPNLSENEASQKEMKREFLRAVCMTSPGPYVILFALDPNNISPNAVGLLQLITNHFGENVLKHVMIVVCHERKKDSGFKERLKKNREFNELIEKCGQRFYLFNLQNSPRELLDRIDDMVMENDSQFYSNHRYQEVEGRIQKEERFIMKEREKEVVKKRKDLENKYTCEELEKELEQFEARIKSENRERAERKISEILGFTVRAVDYVAAVGKVAAVGALCGLPMGFEGMLVGGTVGAIVGCVIGGGVQAAWDYVGNAAAQMNAVRQWWQAHDNND
ncbi:GTPase IMAP family member 4 [Esox lucius]|uniref:AIG1-type G domain-containing protein n=1 Tax=Esox lucius TaxID=8010 RepID=A0AAY5KET3_ESOLU|nr:GTPase IMAP family member 4 [Esox lucius]XP_010862849.2 GTPase IMAP family member 4 [Esox lucius]